MAIKITREQFEKKFGHPPILGKANVQQPQEGLFSEIKSRTSNVAGQMSQQFRGEGEFAGQSEIRKATGIVAQASSIPLGLAKDVLPEFAEQGLEKVGQGIGKGLQWVADKTTPQFMVDLVTRHPDAARMLEEGAGTVANVGEIAGNILGIEGAKQGVVKTAQGVSKAVAPTAEIAGRTLKKATQPIQKFAQPIVQEAKRIPERMATNVAQKQAVQESINKLPSKVARQAAQDGLDVADVKSLYQLPKSQKVPLKKLATVVKDFAEGKTKTNPIEVVGKPIVNRLKELESSKGTIGQKLGKAAEQLGNVSKKELDDAVFNELKKVSGLNGLTKTKLRGLDFKNTTLATELSKTDRMAINKIFSMATKAGTGKSKHLLRQELFEILGGKKRALTALTDTQEKAFNAVRRGLSNVLENKNPIYKTLSNDYRKVVQPLEQMRKIMRVSGEADDILDMSAGLLARRLTSFAQSNPQIKAILNAMDRATKVGGKTRLNVETLQDFYNILEKYYDIAPKTGFQSQVKAGVEKAVGGPIKYLGERIGGLVGETPAVRQKALEKILEEILR